MYPMHAQSQYPLESRADEPRSAKAADTGSIPDKVASLGTTIDKETIRQILNMPFWHFRQKFVRPKDTQLPCNPPSSSQT